MSRASSNYKWIKDLYAEVAQIKETLDMFTIILTEVANNSVFLVPTREPKEEIRAWLKRCIKIINIGE